MFRLPGERVSIVMDDGPFAGAACEVEQIGAWPIRATAVRLVAAFLGAEGADAETLALSELYSLFIGEAQPTWALADHRGPIPASAAGMWRLPIPLALAFIDQWIDPPEPPSTAVDELIPPGPLRDRLNRGLKAKKPAED